MHQKTRRYYSDAEKSEMWGRWQNGESMADIAKAFGTRHSTLGKILRINGGIRPRPRMRSRLALTLAEREAISRGLAQRHSLRSIAVEIGRSPSTVSREVRRNGGCSAYRAHRADKSAWERSKRPQSCKLAQEPKLAKLVALKMQDQWSPQQIAGWLKRNYPNDEKLRVSHETIYRSLFIQAKGALKKELLACLRTERSLRRPRKHASMKGQARV